MQLLIEHSPLLHPTLFVSEHRGTFPLSLGYIYHESGNSGQSIHFLSCRFACLQAGSCGTATPPTQLPTQAGLQMSQMKGIVSNSGVAETTSECLEHAN